MLEMVYVVAREGCFSYRAASTAVASIAKLFRAYDGAECWTYAEAE